MTFLQSPPLSLSVGLPLLGSIGLITRRHVALPLTCSRCVKSRWRRGVRGPFLFEVKEANDCIRQHPRAPHLFRHDLSKVAHLSRSVGLPLLGRIGLITRRHAALPLTCSRCVKSRWRSGVGDLSCLK